MKQTSPRVVSNHGAVWLWLVLSLLTLLPFDMVKGDVATVGTIRRFFDNIPGGNISDLTSNINYINNTPNDYGIYPDMQYPMAGQSPVVTSVGNGQSFTGWLIPSRSGNYTFWIGGTDATALYVGTTSSSSSKVLVAHTDTPSTCGPVTVNGVTSYLPTWSTIAGTSGVSTTISLQAGQMYYFLVLHKVDISHSGIVAVGWTEPTDPPSPNAPAHIIAQTDLSPHSTVNLPNLNLITNTHTNVNANPDNDAASRFLAQATFGATPTTMTNLAYSIADARTNYPTQPLRAYTNWIDAQFTQADTSTNLSTNSISSDLSLGVFRAFVDTYTNAAIPTNPADGSPGYPNDSYRNHTFDGGAIRAGFMINGTHELRRKVAWALSQIFVVGDINDGLYGVPEGECDYFDIFFKDAFKSYKDVLTDVSYHPLMGDFLSSALNCQAGYSAGSHPDENYAREVMQLFSIGLWRLNLDGSYVLSGGQPVQTYDNPEVQQMAKVFTGLAYPQHPVEHTSSGSWYTSSGNARWGVMVSNTNTGLGGLAAHDPSTKTLASFSGWTSPNSIASGGSVTTDINAAIDILSNTPNTAPFFCKQLIQHLVTSNPSPGYITRVSTVFQSNSGNLRPVIKAILLDDEARNLGNIAMDSYGKYQEPWVRLIALSRALSAPVAPTQPNYPLYESYLLPIFGEYPMGSPSVFNFYLPSYSPPGDITARGLVAPEMQILNANTGVQIPNYFINQVIATVPTHSSGHAVTLSFTTQQALAGNTTDLLDNLNTLLTHGNMSSQTYNTILTALNALPGTTNADKLKRARTAVYLIAISPDFAIQK